MQNSNKDIQTKIDRILKTIRYNSDKIIRLEKKIDLIKDEEEKFQAKVAILNYHQDK